MQTSAYKALTIVLSFYKVGKKKKKKFTDIFQDSQLKKKVYYWESLWANTALCTFCSHDSWYKVQTLYLVLHCPAFLIFPARWASFPFLRLVRSLPAWKVCTSIPTAWNIMFLVNSYKFFNCQLKCHFLKEAFADISAAFSTLSSWAASDILINVLLFGSNHNVITCYVHTDVYLHCLSS